MKYYLVSVSKRVRVLAHAISNHLCNTGLVQCGYWVPTITTPFCVLLHQQLWVLAK
jgi:hypothetical protein